MLIARGADVGALDKKGETPLSKLAQCDFNGRFAGRVGATAQALLDAKADPQARGGVFLVLSACGFCGAKC